MKVLIVGAGAVGCYVGGLLALARHEVVFAVRSSTADAMLKSGLQLKGPRGDWNATNIVVHSSPATDAGDFDVGISCVKLYDAESSAREWVKLLGQCAAVVSLQNGVDGQQRIAAGSGLENVYGGLIYVAAKLEGPGQIRYLSDMSSIIFGGPGAMQDATLAEFEEAIHILDKKTPFQATRVEDISSLQWQKFTALATNAALTCLVRRPAGIVYHDQALLDLARQSIAEIVAVGTSCGAHFPPGHEATALQFLQGLPADMVASMHHDLIAGKPLELDGLSGAVVRLGQTHGVPTPFHAMAYACLKPYKDGIMR